jgi:hypothetical protein
VEPILINRDEAGAAKDAFSAGESRQIELRHVTKTGTTTVRGGQLKRAHRHVFLLKTVDSGAMGGQKECPAKWPGCLPH